MVGNSGFSNAPLSKLSLLFVGSSSLLATLLLPSNINPSSNSSKSPLNRLLCLDVNRICISKFEVWRFLTHQLPFSSTGELIVGSILLYSFRLFERQMGSRKFGSFVTVISMTSSIIEFCLLLAYNAGTLKSKGLPSELLLPMVGPYSLIYAMFSLYFLKVPKLHPKLFSIMGIDISNKTIMYILGLQLMFINGWSSVIPSLSGLIAGFLYCFPFTNSKRNPLQNFRLPKFLCRMGNFFRPLLVDGGSTSGHGRQSNQNYRGSNISSTGNSSSVRMNNDPFNNARFRHNTNGNTNTNTAERLIDSGYSRGGLFPGFGGGERRMMGGLGNGMPNIPPSEENISTLMNLGFERADCIRALEQSGNNVDAAANRLLR